MPSTDSANPALDDVLADLPQGRWSDFFMTWGEPIVAYVKGDKFWCSYIVFPSPCQNSTGRTTSKWLDHPNTSEAARDLFLTSGWGENWKPATVEASRFVRGYPFNMHAVPAGWREV